MVGENIGRASVVVLTGPGVSAESGLTACAGPDGLWEGYRPEDLATTAMWKRDPALVWSFYQARRARLPRAEPNPAHHALVRLEARLARAGQEFLLTTQNVDDLHERAGSERLLHLHGELAVLTCERCGWCVRGLEHVDARVFVPCGACGALRMRPDVLWSGEGPRSVPDIDLALARCTHFVVAGASAKQQPVAGLLSGARQLGCRTILNCADAPDELDPRDEFRPGLATVVLPQIVDDLLAEVRC
jgi:NAD-dependent deacetylase